MHKKKKRSATATYNSRRSGVPGESKKQNNKERRLFCGSSFSALSSTKHTSFFPVRRAPLVLGFLFKLTVFTSFSLLYLSAVLSHKTPVGRSTSTMQG